MQLRKLTASKLVVDNVYVAYSSKSKKLSTNGNKGVFVKVKQVKGQDVSVEILGKSGNNVVIRNVDEREDAFIYDPSSAPIPVVVKCEDFNEWPKFTQRMIDQRLNGTEFVFNADELYVNTREGVGEGVTLIRHDAGSINPLTGDTVRDNYRINWIVPKEAPEWRVPRAQRMGIGAVQIPLPPKPVEQGHKEVIEKLQPLLIDMKDGHKDGNNISHFSIKDFKAKDRVRNYVCHAGLRSKDHAEGVDYLITLGVNPSVGGSYCNGLPSTDGAVDWYITYLTSYSPFASLFLSKDVEQIKETGYVIDASFGGNLVACACYATRMLWETPQRIEGMYALYLAGMAPDVAFIFGGQTSIFAKGKMKMGYTSSGHSHFQNDRASDDCYENFLNHEAYRQGKPYSKGGHNSSTDDMWSKNYGERSPIYEKLYKLKGTGYDSSLPVDDFIEQASDIIDEWLVEHEFKTV